MRTVFDTRILIDQAAYKWPRAVAMYMSKVIALIFLMVWLISFPGKLIAHEISPAITTLEATEDGRLQLNILLDLEAAIAGIAPGHEETAVDEASTRYEQLRQMPPHELRDAFELIKDQFLGRISLTSISSVEAGTDVPPQTLRVVTVAIPIAQNTQLARRSILTLEATPEDLTGLWSWRLGSILGDNVIRLRDPIAKKIIGAELISAGQSSSPFSLSSWQHESWTSVFKRYMTFGFAHIVPKGIDHILFIIGLFLLAVRIAALLSQVTAFTVAHTGALALSMIDFIRLPATIVEPLIAASIVYVALENMVTDRVHQWRIAVVFAFGLLHGLGFAGVLQDIGVAPDQFFTSLIAFNIGVELGQLVVIGLCFGAVGWCVRRPWYRQRIVIPGSSIIALIGVIWIFDRVG